MTTKKIKSTTLDGNNFYSILIHNNGCSINDIFSEIDICVADEGTKIENTYLAVVEFIKWDNEQNK